jgi:hypothetical protein
MKRSTAKLRTQRKEEGLQSAGLQSEKDCKAKDCKAKGLQSEDSLARTQHHEGLKAQHKAQTRRMKQFSQTTWL